MRIVAQRVSEASVSVGDEVVGRIDVGLCLLVGIESGDDERDVLAAVEKISNLRIFPDDEGKMNRSLLDAGGSVLVVSQFTLLGDIRRGRRPSFTSSAEPTEASRLVDLMANSFAAAEIETATGSFGERMEVHVINDGPVTFIIEVKRGVVS